MKIHRLPEKIRLIIFDIDGTLYTSPEYVAEQVDVQIRHWAEIRGVSAQSARDEISEFRKKWSLEHGGRKISLGNTFLRLGIPIETSIEWRNSLLCPEKYLKKNGPLIESIGALAERFMLCCVTNNPVDAARRTLEAIGVAGLILNIVGLDTCHKSKPSKEMLSEARRAAGEVPCEECLSVGDRYDIDLALPLELGMGAVEVGGAEDVVSLAKILLR